MGDIPDAFDPKRFHNMEIDGMVWNGLRWKKKDEGPDEDESYEKPYFLEEPGIPLPNHPLESHPDWPYVLDPRIEAMTDEEDEDEKPLVFEDMRVDPSKEDITYVPPWLRPYIPPPTRASIREGEKIINKPCYIDDDPRNTWVYKEPHTPTLATVSREEWGAQGFKPKSPLDVPVKHVRFTYTGGETDDFPEALGILQTMQQKHKDLGLDDIAYNYLIGRDGAIYEGRGMYADAKRPREFDYLKGDCLDIAYLGDFKNSDPEWYLLKSAIEVINHALQIKVLDPNFKVIPYRTNQQITPKQ
uniref:Peptidoglycan recognition protein n=1 Tax=Nephotettix cincticeps TaxID=94400 RepID=S6AX06_NEPCI|nr:peptidoglycan recognition protein [Nephotettix cincticeps]BBK26511.1 peptidoglycan recognition protein 12 [Nephotettix cincticeps]